MGHICLCLGGSDASVLFFLCVLLIVVGCLILVCLKKCKFLILYCTIILVTVLLNIL